MSSIDTLHAVQKAVLQALDDDQPHHLIRAAVSLTLNDAKSIDRGNKAATARQAARRAKVGLPAKVPA